MTIAELYAKYPNPGLVLRQLQRQGKLPENLAGLNGNRQDPTPPTQSAASSSAAMTSDSDTAKNAGEIKDTDRTEYRRALRDFYVQNNP